jgi:hypothetical protein
MSVEKIEYRNGIKVIHITQDEFDMASNELKQQRLSTCESCEKRDDDSCLECSCLLSVRTSYLDISCPIGKW